MPTDPLRQRNGCNVLYFGLLGIRLVSAPPFVIEILEELEKGANQTDAEFTTDLLLLKEIWLEKLADADLYN